MFNSNRFRVEAMTLNQIDRNPLKIQGVGYAICIIDVYMGMYYNTIIGWAVYYFTASFTSELPWSSCNHSWNTNSCTLVGPTANGTNTSSPAEEYFMSVPVQHLSDKLQIK